MNPVKTSAGTPVIGIVTCGFEGNRQFVTDSYISSVCRAGGCPVLLPCVEEGDRGFMEVMASCCHGFLFCGGELLQDLSLREGPTLNHMQRSRLRSDLCHTISVKKDSILYEIFGKATAVNSFHHQGILTPGEGLTVSATAPDGIPEALEMPSRPFVLGVQWHPECMTRSLNMRRLFLAFVDAARGQDGREGR